MDLKLFQKTPIQNFKNSKDDKLNILKFSEDQTEIF